MITTVRLGIGIAAVLFVLSGAAGCGSSTSNPDGGSSGFAGTGGGGGGSGGSGGPGASGVQGSKRIDQLTPTEAAMVCDFAAQEFGGYGTIMNCGDGTTIEADANQAECVASRPTTCAMTVSQYEVCISEVSCANFLPASCAPLLQCS